MHEYEATNHESNNHLPNEQMLLAQKNAEFDIEVSDFYWDLLREFNNRFIYSFRQVDELYDDIEIEDDKHAIRQALANCQPGSIIELNPADLNANDGYKSPKRARLDINYAIGPAGELEQQYGQKVKVQQVIQQPAPTYNRRKMPLVNRII